MKAEIKKKGAPNKEDREGFSTHLSPSTKDVLDRIKAVYNAPFFKAKYSRADVIKDAILLLGEKHGIKVSGSKKDSRNGVEL